MEGNAPVANPWLPQPGLPEGSHGKPPPPVHGRPAGLTGPAAPQGAGVPRPERPLPVARARPDGGQSWWWLGVHGGAGVSTLERTVPGGRDAARAWPVAGEPQPVVLVARSTAHGLDAVGYAARQWSSRMVTGVELLGLVVVADAPGRRPRPLRDRVRLAAGAVPRLWEVPWVEPWRLGEPHVPRECASLAHDLIRLTRLA
ncbi:DUF6668 family protein [Streptomyces sp. NPDC004134]|uniref:DUF6668 family protein n=1 Tax=Streptomyces sp. NPDC004134 TaxID=3364691 RepID=UPI00368D8940